jgi:hypothetical protein
MTIKSTSLSPAAAAANNIALSQSPAAGAITLNGSLVSGGVATLDVPRRVIITSGGNDSGITFTVTGTNRFGGALSESGPGGNIAAMSTSQDFKTVTSVTHTGTVAGTVTVGTSGVTSSEWIQINDKATVMTPIGIAVAVTGTVNYTVEYTYELNPPSGFPVPYSISAGPLTGKTASGEGGAAFNFPIGAVRLTLNSFTPPATARMTIIQQGPTS